MPSSEPSNIALIIKIMQDLKPTSILDVGVGTGKYGHLFRDYLDGHWVGHAFHDKETWTLRLDGLEVFEEYITLAHEYIYDKLYTTELYSFFTGLKTKTDRPYDVIFMGDVIEHLPKEDGMIVINSIFMTWLNSGGALVLSTPNFDTTLNNPHRAVFHNLYEIHRSRWYAKDFLALRKNVQVFEDRLLTVVMK